MYACDDDADGFPRVPSERPRMKLPMCFNSMSSRPQEEEDVPSPTSQRFEKAEVMPGVQFEIVDVEIPAVVEDSAEGISTEDDHADDIEHADDIDTLLSDLHEFLRDLHGGVEAAQTFRKRIHLLSSTNRRASLIVRRRMTIWGRLLGRRGEAFSTFLLRSVINQPPWLKVVRLCQLIFLTVAILSLFGKLPKYYCIFSLTIALQIVILWGMFYWDVIKCIIQSFECWHYLTHVIITWVSAAHMASFDVRLCILSTACIFWTFLMFIDAAPPVAAEAAARQLFVRVVVGMLIPCLAVACLVSFWFDAVPGLVDTEFKIGAFTTSISSLFSSSIANVIAYQLKVSFSGGLDVSGTTTFYSLPTELKFHANLQASDSESVSFVSRSQAALRPSFHPSPSSWWRSDSKESRSGRFSYLKRMGAAVSNKWRATSSE